MNESPNPNETPVNSTKSSVAPVVEEKAPVGRVRLYVAVLALGVGGSLFAGYLTFFKAITGKCALGEACPIVLGLPACIYGFVMFLAITLLAVRVLLRGTVSWVPKALLGVAGFGIAFAGILSATEIAGWLASGRAYALVLPSCVYGLVFYIAVFCLSWRLSAAKDGGK
jgi:hypothetical protein